MDDYVCELGKSFHEAIFHHMRRGVRRLERRLSIEPDVQVHERIIRGASCSNVMAAHHLGHRLDDRADVVFGNHDLVRQDS